MAFVSSASNLAPKSLRDEVFVADVETGKIELVTVPAQTAGWTRFSTHGTLISADGRYVAYNTRRYDVITGTSSIGRDHVFVRDRQQGVTLWANRTFDTAATLQPLAFFDSKLWMMVNTDLYVFDLIDLSFVRVGFSNTEPAFSSDGSLIALQSSASKSNIVQRYHVDTKVFDTLVQTTSVFARYRGLSISDNGRVAFLADAQLVPEDTDTNIDVYVTPAVGAAGPLVLASSMPPTNATQVVSNPAISGDGSRVYFRMFTRFADGRQVGETLARDLSASLPETLGASGARQNLSRILVSPGGVFLAAESNLFGFPQASSETDLVFLPAPITNPDSDNDGLPDAWEMTAFGSLAENGSGDPDQDGMSNLAEYLAGTDPARSDSVLRLEIVNASDARHLIYPASLNPVSVEYRNTLGGADWTALQTASIETDGRPSFLDSTNVPQRFYRIRLLP